MPLPDEAGRAAILAVHMRGVPLARELDPPAVCELISKMTRGASIIVVAAWMYPLASPCAVATCRRQLGNAFRVVTA